MSKVVDILIDILFFFGLFVIGGAAIFGQITPVATVTLGLGLYALTSLLGLIASFGTHLRFKPESYTWMDHLQGWEWSPNIRPLAMLGVYFSLIYILPGQLGVLAFFAFFAILWGVVSERLDRQNGNFWHMREKAKGEIGLLDQDSLDATKEFRKNTKVIRLVIALVFGPILLLALYWGATFGFVGLACVAFILYLLTGHDVTRLNTTTVVILGLVILAGLIFWKWAIPAVAAVVPAATLLKK